MKQKLIVIAGTNASGKSGLGIELAGKYNAEIVSADSRQVFMGLNLGSGKVTEEEMQGIKHHLLDVAEPGDFFSLSDYQKLAYKAIDDIAARGKNPFLVGGTGLYVNSVVDGYRLTGDSFDPEIRKKVEAMEITELIGILNEKAPGVTATMDLANKRRLERAAEKALMGLPMHEASESLYNTLVIGVTWPRDVLYERIRIRLDRRLEQGMIDEVAGLRARGVDDDFLYRLGLEYRYILKYLRNEYKSFDDFYEELFKEIRHLAKEQMTWFRKRSDMHWIDMEKQPVKEAIRLIDNFLALKEAE